MWGVKASLAMDFTYRLVGTGWAEASISDGMATATITASYLEDALGVLLKALSSLLDGAPEAQCSWEEEPGEYRWVFENSETDVHLRILSFPDIHPHKPDHQGVVVFETRQPLRGIAESIADGAEAVLDRYGEEDYLRLWVDSPFPTGQLEKVQERLKRD
jgi:hypothetical protein